MPKKKNDNSEVVKKELHLSITPTSSTNSFRIAVDDDLSTIMIQLISDLPEDVGIENHRTSMSYDTAVYLVDSLTQTLDYYPKKPVKRKKRVTKKSK